MAEGQTSCSAKIIMDEGNKWHRGDIHEQVSTIYRTSWFEIKNRDGYLSLEYGVPQVVILPVVDRKKILMVRVKRPLIGDSPWELPAGGCEGKEIATEAARRELAEETGIFIEQLERFEELPILSELPNRSPELLLCYKVNLDLAEYKNRSAADSEIVLLRLFDFKTLKQAILTGEIYVSSAIAVIARFLMEREQS